MMARRVQKFSAVASGEGADAPTGSPNVGSKPIVEAITTVVQSEDFKNIYSNNVRIGISQWDLSITVGQIVEVQGGSSVVEEKVSVKFSPQYFKVLSSTLSAAIQQWEMIFGEIPQKFGQSAGSDNIVKALSGLKDLILSIDEKAKESS